MISKSKTTEQGILETASICLILLIKFLVKLGALEIMMFIVASKSKYFAIVIVHAWRRVSLGVNGLTSNLLFASKKRLKEHTRAYHPSFGFPRCLPNQSSIGIDWHRQQGESTGIDNKGHRLSSTTRGIGGIDNKGHRLASTTRGIDWHRQQGASTGIDNKGHRLALTTRGIDNKGHRLASTTRDIDNMLTRGIDWHRQQGASTGIDNKGHRGHRQQGALTGTGINNKGHQQHVNKGHRLASTTRGIDCLRTRIASTRPIFPPFSSSPKQ